MRPIRTVGVVGAGTMGLGIAQVCAVNGFRTSLFDINPDQVSRARKTIEENLSASVARGKLSAEVSAATMTRIQPVVNLADLIVDLVIEAAVEKLDVKQALFTELEKVNEGNAVLATNTSSISISHIAGKLRDPGSCIGFHFFNPADRMKLVEIISGKDTRPEVVETLRQFSAAIGKTSVIAKDSPGFIVNRVARHFYVESLKLLEGKAANTETIDELLRATGFRMGPFELMDLIGVDTNLAVTTSVYEGFGRAHRFTPSRTQQELVRQGHYGRKTGRGFYEYKGTSN